MRKNLKISAIVCTFNRCEVLKENLVHFLNQDCKGFFDYEIIVVDNNSHDRTSEMMNTNVHKYPEKLKYLIEFMKGKSYVFNAGIRASKGEILVFTNDDCVPGDTWLFKIWNKFQEDNELDVVIGGVLNKDGISVYKPENINNQLRGNGMNYAFRRKLFSEIGYFDVFLGAGSIGFSAEDIEFLYRAKLSHKKIEICNDITIIHDHQKIDNKDRYRDMKGYVIFLLKYTLLRRDIFALKKIKWCITGVLHDFFLAILSTDFKLAKAKCFEFIGVIVSIFKGIYIWLVLYPLNRHAES